MHPNTHCTPTTKHMFYLVYYRRLPYHRLHTSDDRRIAVGWTGKNAEGNLRDLIRYFPVCTDNKCKTAMFVLYMPLTFWRRIFFFNFSTPCIQNVNNTGTKYVQAMFVLYMPLTFWRRNYFFLILAHSVYKMWIIQEPNTLELWNKLHFEGEKNGEYIPCLKYSVPIFDE